MTTATDHPTAATLSFLEANERHARLLAELAGYDAEIVRLGRDRGPLDLAAIEGDDKAAAQVRKIQHRADEIEAKRASLELAIPASLARIAAAEHAEQAADRKQRAEMVRDDVDSYRRRGKRIAATVETLAADLAAHLEDMEMQRRRGCAAIPGYGHIIVMLRTCLATALTRTRMLDVLPPKERKEFGDYFDTIANGMQAWARGQLAADTPEPQVAAE